MFFMGFATLIILLISLLTGMTILLMFAKFFVLTSQPIIMEPVGLFCSNPNYLVPIPDT